MLTEKQKQACKMLCIDGMKVQDTAAALGVHRCTIWRWSRKKEFAKEWKRLLREYIREQRKASGYYEQQRAHRARIRQLQRKAEEESRKIRNGYSRAFDRAWKAYTAELFDHDFFRIV